MLPLPMMLMCAMMASQLVVATTYAADPGCSNNYFGDIL
jgi:hypothetical protein